MGKGKGHWFARAVLAACFLVSVRVLWMTHAVVGGFTCVVGGPVSLGSDVNHVAFDSGAAIPLSGRPPVVRFDKPGKFVVTAASPDFTGTYHITVVDTLTFYAAVFALLGIGIATPISIAPRGANGHRPWLNLLSEPGGGLSLGRVQLLIWFLPAAIFWGASSLIAHGPAPIDNQLAILLGLSGATTMLGAASNPKAADSAAETDLHFSDLHLSDLVQDWNSHGDLSRYQYLFLSLIGSLVLTAGFVQNLEFPEIPAPLLYLVAASQGTYIATKAIKTSRRDEGSATVGTSIAISAGPSSLRLGVGECVRVPAPDGHATEEGDIVVPDRARRDRSETTRGQ